MFVIISHLGYVNVEAAPEIPFRFRGLLCTQPSKNISSTTN